MNKIVRMGSVFFTIVLWGFSALKYAAGSTRVAIYFFVAGLGFSLVYISYTKKDRISK
ncbi:MAG: hypothetical protein K0R50_4150 [Eubacterium sp.]|nr:hypothetical protein [Eubacterium sp.]